MISFSHVTAGYRGRKVFSDLSLDLPEGEIVSLIGPNGCGKTTLLRAACGMLPLQAGAVFFGGKELRTFRRKEFAKRVALLPQSRDIPSISAESLVLHGRYPHLAFGRSLTSRDFQAAELAMEETGTLPLRHKELSALSGGERQKVYLAMILAQDPDILFLDEPTTYLDIGQKYEILELIRKLNAKGKTIVMVLHDLSLAFSYSHRVAVLEQGRVAAFGPGEEVFDSGIPAKVFGVRCKKLPVDGKTEYVFLGEGETDHGNRERAN